MSMEMVKGLKTVIIGLLLAVGPAGTAFLLGVDWSFLGPVGAFVVSGIIMVVMRFFTTTPIGQSD